MVNHWVIICWQLTSHQMLLNSVELLGCFIWNLILFIIDLFQNVSESLYFDTYTLVVAIELYAKMY